MYFKKAVIDSIPVSNMIINIADNLKRLRKQRDITQEELASFIGVSFQAVSKWERNEGYPDITLLPVIANFFDVTLDELMGMDEIRNKEHMNDVLAMLKENYSNGRIADNIALIRDELKAFPTNYKLLFELAASLTMLQSDPDTEKKNKKEAIKICERIMEHCTDTKIRNNTQANLCFYYSWVGETEKAVEQAKKLPSIWKCKDAILPALLTGEDAVKEGQQAIVQFADAIRLQLRDLADADHRKNYNWTNKERITMLQKSIDIYDIVFDQGDYLFYHVYLSETYRNMAAFSLLVNEREQAIGFLTKAVDHSVQFDRLPGHIKHTSLLVNRLEHNKQDTSKNFSHNWSYLLLNQTLTQDRYDCIRSDVRFIQLENALKAVAE